ncbi:MAG: hypothetical protein MUD15_09090 [Desulfobacterota bacterium]|nr:hypothetical protein [Thermodesulfobacteriota bacterium]
MCTELDAKEKAGILGVMLRSPVFKDILRTNLNEMSPSTGSSMVKTLMYEDPEVFFAVISSLPVFINALLRSSAEFALQLKDKYPPLMLKSYLLALSSDIDRENLKRSWTVWSELISSLWEASGDLREEAGRFILNQGPAIAAGFINRFARAVNTVDPPAFSTFLTGVFSRIDRAEIDRSARTIAGALLDQKWHLASWVWSFAKVRVMKRLGLVSRG